MTTMGRPRGFVNDLSIAYKFARMNQRGEKEGANDPLRYSVSAWSENPTVFSNSRDIGNSALPLDQMCGVAREYAAQGCVLVHNRFSDVFH